MTQEFKDVQSMQRPLIDAGHSPSLKTPDKKNEKAKDQKTGHRDRLRQRFLKGGPKALADYELLELILFMAIPRKDVKPLAKDLIARFKSFAGVMAASVEELCSVKGVSENTATCLKAIQAASHLMLQEQILSKDVISSWQALLDYCNATMAHENIEQFRVIFLDKKNRILADEVQQTGTIDHTPVYPREVIKRALEIHSTAVILIHNHPSGDPKPSQADIEMTNAIIDAGKTIGITVHDHLIIAKNDFFSFRNSGLLYGR